MLKIVESFSDPGEPGQRGDDRWGIDTAGSSAWVLDGASDVTGFRVFPSCPSDAGWFAEALSQRLRDGRALREGILTYWADVLAAVRVRAIEEAGLPLAKTPLAAIPAVAGIWVNSPPESIQVEFCWFGDCVALVRTATGEVKIIGAAPGSSANADMSRETVAVSPPSRDIELILDRERTLQAGTRALALVSVDDACLSVTSLDISGDMDCLLVSDGFFRVIYPFEMFTPISLFKVLDTRGLAYIGARLRLFEVSSVHPICHFKRRDDATALWIRFVAE